MTDHPEPDRQLELVEQELGAQLAAERALPAPEFRGLLGRHLTARDPGYGPRPERLRTTVLLYVCAGFVVTGLGLLQALGVL